ncbi:MAG TPA: class I SAM-dependent methyltransferase [Candidatus Acidoferrales bacterium]|nr:class I SAM-dependent methyltransferase [Candidatus Acidoferrales bacterium]
MGLASKAWHKLNRAVVKLCPDSGLARYYRRRQFSNVYKWASWGHAPDSKYFSGMGSAGPAAHMYVEKMSQILASIVEKSTYPPTIVDLGCGDFRVGSELVRRLQGARYVGCDIVSEVIAENTRRFGSDHVRFQCLDLVSETLPEGDVYLVRQVFQHLPNADIAIALAKLASRRHVFVTEGQPKTLVGPANPDKPIGGDVRFDWERGRGRGVELDQPPFGLPIREILRAPAVQQNSGEVIVTWELAKA